MSKDRTRKLLLLLSALVGYIAVLYLLVLAESKAPNASIQTFWQALWYSIVTLSTVGYGDLYPVTPIGKLIGLLFVLLSLGLLTFLLGTIVSAWTRRILPALQLYFQRNKQWYIFSECNSSTLTLAQDLAASESDCVFLFPQQSRQQLPSELPCLYYPGTIAQAARLKTKKCSLFFMAEESGSNYPQALAHVSVHHPIYCRTEHPQEHLPDNLTLFNRYACCAWEYWHSLPLQASEKCIVLLGDGNYAQRILETGLMINIALPGHSMQYHIFGQWQDFRNNHPQLGLTISLESADPDRDCLFFHRNAWNADESLLRHADRIILCYDNEKENLNILRQLRCYFATTGAVHLRAEMDIPGELTFGTNKKIYSRELILRTQLTHIARTMHQIYLDSTGVSTPTWEELSEFTRQSNICAAEHLLVKIRLLLGDETIRELTPQLCARAYHVYSQTKSSHADFYRRIEHLRWMRFYSMYNWRYAPQRDNTMRHHPSLLPFDQLTPSEQEKDDYAWEMLTKLAENC